jgi:hypothetical protein
LRKKQESRAHTFTTPFVSNPITATPITAISNITKRSVKKTPGKASTTVMTPAKSDVSSLPKATEEQKASIIESFNSGRKRKHSQSAISHPKDPYESAPKPKSSNRTTPNYDGKKNREPSFLRDQPSYAFANEIQEPIVLATFNGHGGQQNPFSKQLQEVVHAKTLIPECFLPNK